MNFRSLYKFIGDFMTFSCVSCRLWCLSLPLPVEVAWVWALTSAWAGWRPKSSRQSLFWFSQHRERNVKLKLLFAGCARNQGIYSTELLMWKQSPRLSKSVVWQTRTSLVIPLLLRKRSRINLTLFYSSLKFSLWMTVEVVLRMSCRVAGCWGSYSCR